jgi:hypothetical protein
MVFVQYLKVFRTLAVCAIFCAMTNLIYATDYVVSNISTLQLVWAKSKELHQNVSDPRKL